MEADLTTVPQNPEELDPNDNGGHADTLEATSGTSSDDSDSDNEAQEALDVQTLESELSRNSSNYDAHVQV